MGGEPQRWFSKGAMALTSPHIVNTQKIFPFMEYDSSIPVEDPDMPKFSYVPRCS